MKKNMKNVKKFETAKKKDYIVWNYIVFYQILFETAKKQNAVWHFKTAKKNSGNSV